MAVRALKRCTRTVNFARAIFLTDAVPDDVRVPEGIELIPVGPIGSREAYSRIVMKGLYKHIATSHVLIVQWDGYVVHPEVWKDEFLTYDYLGAPCPDGKGGWRVGNGGFSLRSRKLLEALQDESFPLLFTAAEDVTICGCHGARLESDFGIRFGPLELARTFSFERDASDVIRGMRTFGFHGMFNFFLVESQHELISLAPTLSESIATLEATELLLKNLLKFELFESAVALGRRMVEANPENEKAAEAVVMARERLETQYSEDAKANSKPIKRVALRLTEKLRGWL